ncbi:MAG: hypothetical protein ACJ72U_10545 [Nitrososphaeraceae archaeon]
MITYGTDAGPALCIATPLALGGNVASTIIHRVTADMPITKKIRSDLILIRKISSAMAKRIIAIVIITSQRSVKSIL